MIEPFIKEFIIPEVAANTQYPVTVKGRVFSESIYSKFVPFMSISVLNKSTEEIKVFINETDNNAFRLTPNSSRSLTGVPIWQITIVNTSDNTISANSIMVTVINDLEQVSRYNAYAKSRSY